MKKIFILFMIFISLIISCSNNNKSEDGISIFINTGPEPKSASNFNKNIYDINL